MRFATSQGFNSGDQFFSYLKDSFDVLYAEAVQAVPAYLEEIWLEEENWLRVVPDRAAETYLGNTMKEG